MESMPIDKFRLRFPDDLEREYRDDYYIKSLAQLRLGIFLGALLYALLGFLDVRIFPEVKEQTWFIRYGIVVPSCLALLLYSWSSKFKHYMQRAVFVVVLLSGAGIIAMMVIVRSPVNYFHFAGLLLIIMYSYTFSKMRFLYTAFASWGLVVMYNISAIWIFPLPISVILNDNFFYIAANLIGMSSSYNRELYMRRDFYRNRMVQSLETQKHIHEKEKLHEAVEQALISFRESEEKFRTLAETAAIAIFIHQGGNFLYANRAAENIGGYTVEEYRTMNFLGLVHPDYVDMIKARARERLSGGQAPQQYEFKIVRKDGEERWVLMTAGITMYEGKPAVIGTLIDITARKRAEDEREQLYLQLRGALQSLKESEARFRILTETTAAGIIIHRGGRLIYANPAVSKITGFTNDEFLAQDFWAIVHPDYRALVRERAMGRLHGEPVPSEYEVRIIIKNGEARWSNLTAGVIDYEGGPAIIVTLFDITDRKRTDEEKVKLYEERISEEKRHLMEKEKILMDLHDGIGGITTNISILSELAQKSTDLEGVKKTLSTISRLSREGISEIRSFMHSLDTKELNWRTLATEMRSQGTTVLEPHGIAFTLVASVHDVREQPGSLLWVNLFKIYKEALTNIIKHAKAGSVFVTLDGDRAGLVLVVQDDGTEWEASRGSGRGLLNMMRRAEEVGGTLTTLSTGNGFLVRLEIPIPIKYPSRGMAL